MNDINGPVAVIPRPPRVQAMQYTGDNAQAFVDWLQGGRWRDDGIWIRQRFASDEDIEDNKAKAGEPIFQLIVPVDRDRVLAIGIGGWLVRDNHGALTGMDERDFLKQWMVAP